jgi:hypothetical protein
MRINTEDKDVRGLLGYGWYRVPRMPHPYRWLRNQVEDFWNATIVKSTGGYFVGTVVLYSLDKGLYRMLHGQQRFIVIVLALYALRNAFRDFGLKDQAEELQNLIEKPQFTAKLQPALRPELSHADYSDVIIRSESQLACSAPIRAVDANLAAAYDYIAGYLEAQRTAVLDDPRLSSRQKERELRDRLTAIRDKLLSLKVNVTTLQPAEYLYDRVDARYFYYCRMCGGSGEYKEYKPCAACEGTGLVRKFWWVRLWNWMTKRQPVPLDAWA